MTGTLATVAACGVATVQDGGRVGYAGVGVAASGPLHRERYEVASTLLAGRVDPSVPTLEVLVGDLVLDIADDTCAVVVGPANCRIAEPGGRTLDVAAHVVVAVRAGERLAVERDDRLGSGPVYVALSGWSPDRVLGSCATDTFGRIGGAVAGPGYVLRGAAARGANRVGAYWRPVPTATGPVRVVPTQGILGGSWQVDAVSRSGIRLQAREDLRAGGSTALAPSQPVVPGTVQRLPTGGLIVLGPDGGVTGGYPVAAVVATVDLDRLWLLAPGSAVRFAPVTVEAAAHAFVQQQVRVRRGFGHPDLSG